MMKCSDGERKPGLCICPHVVNDPLKLAFLEWPSADGSEPGSAYCQDCTDAIDRYFERELEAIESGRLPESGNVLITLGVRPVCWPCFERNVLAKVDLESIASLAVRSENTLAHPWATIP